LRAALLTSVDILQPRMCRGRPRAVAQASGPACGAAFGRDGAKRRFGRLSTTRKDEASYPEMTRKDDK
jgi:hypothetical protein